MSGGYDKIAPFYDFLSRIVYGKSIIKVQQCLIKSIPKTGDFRVLIVGGGTGWILEELSNRIAGCLMIDYVEASEKMISISKKRNYLPNHVSFTQKPIEQFKNTELYDFILTPFLFDNFEQSHAEYIFRHLDTMLAKEGKWLYSDFDYHSWTSPIWQKFLLRFMYFFFRNFAGIEAHNLPDMESCFSVGYRKHAERAYFMNFIKGSTYVRGLKD